MLADTVSICSLAALSLFLYTHSPHQIFVGGLDQEVNDADFRAYFAK